MDSESALSNDCQQPCHMDIKGISHLHAYLTAQLSVGYIELAEHVARRERHFVQVTRVPSCDREYGFKGNKRFTTQHSITNLVTIICPANRALNVTHTYPS